MGELFSADFVQNTFPILLLTGMCAGILAGLLGVGGGIVIVPVLFLLAENIGISGDVAMHVAVGTSLSTIILTSISSAKSHDKKGNVDRAIFLNWAPFILFGSITGGVLSNFFTSNVLTTIFGVVALLMALNLLVGKEFQVADRPPSSFAGRTFIGLVIGGISSLMGIGGGTLSVPTLTMHGFPMHRAVGTSAAFGFLIAVAGTLGFIWSGWGVDGRGPFSVGYVNTPAAIVIFCSSIFFAPLGSKIANWLSAKHLRIAFGVFLVISAVKMLTS